MANIAECALAIAKQDLDKLDGAIRKAKPNETTYSRYEAVYFDKGGNKHILEEEYWDGYAKHKMFLDGTELTEEEFRDKQFQGSGKWETKQDQAVCNGWFVDWKKLKGFSYQSETYIQEHDDCVEVDFGGRWDFPHDTEDYLNSLDICWQGAALDDAMDWRTDELGTCDLGLRVVDDEESWATDDGRDIYGHHIEYCEGEDLAHADHRARKQSLLDTLEYFNRKLGEKGKEEISTEALRDALTNAINFIKEGD